MSSSCRAAETMRHICIAALVEHVTLSCSSPRSRGAAGRLVEETDPGARRHAGHLEPSGAAPAKRTFRGPARTGCRPSCGRGPAVQRLVAGVGCRSPAPQGRRCRARVRVGDDRQDRNAKARDGRRRPCVGASDRAKCSRRWPALTAPNGRRRRRGVAAAARDRLPGHTAGDTVEKLEHGSTCSRATGR